MTDRFADILAVSAMSRALRGIDARRLEDASVRAAAYVGAGIPPAAIARLDSRVLKTEQLRRALNPERVL